MRRAGQAFAHAPSGERKIPVAAASVFLLVALLGCVGPNFIFGALSLIVLAVGLRLLWRPGESPILLFVFGLGWLGTSVSIFHANSLGQSLAEYAAFASDMPVAVVLSMLGLVAMAAGMRMGAGRWAPKVGDLSRQKAVSQPAVIWFRLYVVAAFAAFTALGATGFAPGLFQLIIGFGVIKWAAYFMLAYATMARRGETRAFLLAAFLIELVQGVGGFFSDFKTVFFMTLLAALASGVRQSRQTLLAVSVLAVLLVMLAITWTAVKEPYRQFVSGGTNAQAVTVPLDERLLKFSELVGDLDGEAVSRGFDSMLKRLSYVDFFGVTLNIVPSVVPHTKGEIYIDALVRPFMPRIFFEDKTAINDTARTNQFTGGLAGNSEGTSISLGFIAEAYIDFGPFGMMAALALVGYLYGYLYKLLTGPTLGAPLLGMAISTGMLVGVGSLENSFTKTFGGIMATLIVAFIFMRWVVPVTYPWLTHRRR